MPFSIPKETMNKIDLGEISLRQYLGLMFRLRPPTIAFNLKTPKNIPLHSLFCRTFVAIWYDEKNKIIEKKLVKPFRINIKPSKPYKKLVEIPYYLIK